MASQRPDTTGPGDKLDSMLPMWADENVIAAYRFFHPTAVTFLRPSINALIAEGEIRPGMRVLDVGTGTGIPALAVAEAVGPTGHVVASDPSAAMLTAARENAGQAALGNISFAQAVAESLPFADHSFDAVLSHAGIMFAADLKRALSEIARVARPQARAAFIAWGRVDDNPWLTGFWNALHRYREQLEPSDRGATGEGDAPRAEPDPRTPFRFAEPGSLSAALREAFDDVREERRSVALEAPGRGEILLEMFLTLSGFGRELPADLLPQFREDVLRTYDQYRVGSRVGLPAAFVVASGKPRPPKDNE